MKEGKSNILIIFGWLNALFKRIANKNAIHEDSGLETVYPL